MVGARPPSSSPRRHDGLRLRFRSDEKIMIQPQDRTQDLDQKKEIGQALILAPRCRLCYHVVLKKTSRREQKKRALLPRIFNCVAPLVTTEVLAVRLYPCSHSGHCMEGRVRKQDTFKWTGLWRRPWRTRRTRGLTFSRIALRINAPIVIFILLFILAGGANYSWHTICSLCCPHEILKAHQLTSTSRWSRNCFEA